MSSPVSDAEALLLSLLDKERNRVEELEKTLREIAEIAERFSLTSGTRPRFDVADVARRALS